MSRSLQCICVSRGVLELHHCSGADGVWGNRARSPGTVLQPSRPCATTSRNCLQCHYQSWCRPWPNPLCKIPCQLCFLQVRPRGQSV